MWYNELAKVIMQFPAMANLRWTHFIGSILLIHTMAVVSSGLLYFAFTRDSLLRQEVLRRRVIHGVWEKETTVEECDATW